MARIVSNGIDLSVVDANRAALTTLSHGRLDLDSAAARSLLGTADQRELLGYLVSCALPKHVTLSTRYHGTRYDFEGRVGLARKWQHTHLTDKDRRWVSACLLARINVHRAFMYISLRGPHSALKTTEAEAQRFPLEEGVFYGDVFTGSAPLVGWSCRGQAQAAGEPAPDTALGQRDCAESSNPNPTAVATFNQCGFGFAGDAWDFTPETPSPQACEQRLQHSIDDCEADDDNGGVGAFGPGFYKRCHVAPAIGGFSEANLFREVITVYVEAGPPSLVDPG